MRTRRTKGALLHAPIQVELSSCLESLPPSLKRSGTKDSESFGTFGNEELCTWRVAPGLFWIQTRDKNYARKLHRRSDTQKVEICGHNCFLQTYEIAGTWRKVKRLISRYISVTPDRISPPTNSYNTSEFASRANTAGLPIPLGLVTPDQISATIKISADASACRVNRGKKAIPTRTRGFGQ
jgi:hypothetical protein